MAFGVNELLTSIARTVNNTREKERLLGIRDVLQDFIESPGFLNNEDKPKVRSLIQEIDRKTK